jgi:drug/metabolite transporter (DMT)-like permease
MMIVEMLAICAAFFYGSSGVLVRKGLISDSESSPLSAAFATMLIQFVVMWSLCIFDFPPLNLEAILIFALSGVVAQCIGRTVNYIGVSKLGVSRNNPIVGANPLFSVLIAAIFLSEVVTPPLYAGVVLIILGIVLISLQNKGANEMEKGKNWLIILPLIAAVCYGFSANLRKIGLNMLPFSIAGSTFAVSGALGVYIPFVSLLKRIKNFSLRRFNIYFLGSGLSVSLAWIFSFTALVMGEVSTVAPIQGASPLFALILSKIFLKKAEKITWKIATGALALVSGVIIISMFK